MLSNAGKIKQLTRKKNETENLTKKRKPDLVWRLEQNRICSDLHSSVFESRLACGGLRMKLQNDNSLQMGMSACLTALGFEAMAAQVQTEFAVDRLKLYARVILKNAKGENHNLAFATLRKAGLC
jgi:hypothetical protein